ncbi:MAG: DUF3108 domain-containing protein [Gallionella sp.]
MIAILNTTARRLTFAIALSVLVHAAILWLPYVQLPHAKVELPPLSVRLEPLPKPVEQIAGQSESAKSEPANPISKPDSSSTAKPLSKAMAAMNKSDEPTQTHPFPRHLHLTFIVYKDADGSRTGEIRHQLDIHGSRYSLRSERQTAGLASLRNSDRIVQTSYGKIGDHGLQPDTFEKEEITDSGKRSLQATFDWAAQKLHFSNGSEISLPADAQDVLSFMYQISQLPMNGEFFTMPISDGMQLQQDQIEIGTKEDLATPMGKLRALHLRKMHADREAYFEIWLGLEYRLLPVKFRQIDSSGNMIEEFVITDIRAADE